jgi:hypothetical protein
LYNIDVLFPLNDSNTVSDDKTIEEVRTTKFLDLQADNLNWKTHIEYIIPKPTVCFAMRTDK